MWATTSAAIHSHQLWYERAWDSLPGVAEILTAVVAAIAVAGFVRGVYRRTVGRRRNSYARLKRLGTSAQLSFFASALGEPPAIRRSLKRAVGVYDDHGGKDWEVRSFVEAVFIDRDFYVQVYADHDETVQAYSVTTRSKRFKPSFRAPGAFAVERRWLPQRWERFRYRFIPQQAVKLGKTRFIELGQPDCAAAWRGAHNAHYFEAYHFGNPGNYQTFVYSLNDAGAWTWDAPWSDAMQNVAWGFARTDGATEEPPQQVRAFRHRARVNTYTVIGSGLALDDYPGAEGRLDEYPVTFGVNSTRVRTLG